MDLGDHSYWPYLSIQFLRAIMFLIAIVNPKPPIRVPKIKSKNGSNQLAEKRSIFSPMKNSPHEFPSILAQKVTVPPGAVKEAVGTNFVTNCPSRGISLLPFSLVRGTSLPSVSLTSYE